MGQTRLFAGRGAIVVLLAPATRRSAAVRAGQQGISSRQFVQCSAGGHPASLRASSQTRLTWVWQRRTQPQPPASKPCDTLAHVPRQTRLAVSRSLWFHHRFTHHPDNAVSALQSETTTSLVAEAQHPPVNASPWVHRRAPAQVQRALKTSLLSAAATTSELTGQLVDKRLRRQTSRQFSALLWPLSIFNCIHEPHAGLCHT
jgi:hypothetical protein